MDYVVNRTAMKERGASLVEYSLLVSLIAILAIGGVRVLGVNVTRPFCVVTGAIVSDGNANAYNWLPDDGSGRPDCQEVGGFGGSVWY